jgi:hypothetical protein
MLPSFSRSGSTRDMSGVKPLKPHSPQRHKRNCTADGVTEGPRRFQRRSFRFGYRCETSPPAAWRLAIGRFSLGDQPALPTVRGHPKETIPAVADQGFQSLSPTSSRKAKSKPWASATIASRSKRPSAGASVITTISWATWARGSGPSGDAMLQSFYSMRLNFEFDMLTIKATSNKNVSVQNPFLQCIADGFREFELLWDKVIHGNGTAALAYIERAQLRQRRIGLYDDQCLWHAVASARPVLHHLRLDADHDQVVRCPVAPRSSTPRPARSH